MTTLTTIDQKVAAVENEAVCCPRFQPAPWDDTLLEWEKKRFIRAAVPTLFYIPLGFGRVMRKLDRLAATGGAKWVDHLCLSEHVSPWRMDLYLAVDREVPGAENVTISGKFYSRVYEGEFRDTGKWMDEAGKEAAARWYDIRRWFMWYTTCPRCAKKYGENYVVLLGQVE